MGLADRDYMRPESGRPAPNRAVFRFGPSAPLATGATARVTHLPSTAGKVQASCALRRATLWLLALACLVHCAGIIISIALGVFARTFEATATSAGIAPPSLWIAAEVQVSAFIILLGCIATLAVFNVMLFRPMRIASVGRALLALSQPVLASGAFVLAIIWIERGSLDLGSWSDVVDRFSRASAGSAATLMLFVGIVASAPAFALSTALPPSATPSHWWLAIDRGDSSAVLTRCGYLQFVPLILIEACRYCSGVANPELSALASSCIRSSWAPFVIASLFAVPLIMVVRRAWAMLRVAWAG